jgi:hypothetical protein
VEFQPPVCVHDGKIRGPETIIPDPQLDALKAIPEHLARPFEDFQLLLIPSFGFVALALLHPAESLEPAHLSLHLDVVLAGEFLDGLLVDGLEFLDVLFSILPINDSPHSHPDLCGHPLTGIRIILTPCRRSDFRNFHTLTSLLVFQNNTGIEKTLQAKRIAFFHLQSVFPSAIVDFKETNKGRME